MAVTLAARRLALDARRTLIRAPMQKFVIEGGAPLSGSVTPAGNKNGALPILAAALLTAEPVVISQRTADPRRRRDGRAARGTRSQREWQGENEISLCAADVEARPVDAELADGSARRSCSPARCSRASAAPRCRHPAVT